MKPEIKQRIMQIKNGQIPQGYKKTKIGIVPSDWEEDHLKKYFSKLSRKNIEKNTNVLTISAQHGLINQNEFFNKEIASSDKSNYYLLKKGEFAYNKSYSNGYPYGAIKKLKKYEKGIVSPLYICFSVNHNNKHPQFFEYYFELGKMNKEIKAFAQEGARNHGLLNIEVSDFFNSHVTIPSGTEQKKIIEILSSQDKVIELKEKLIEEKKKQKKYLMQNLLTGKMRLKGFISEWKRIELGKIFDYVQPTPYIVKTAIYDDNYKTPVLTAGKSFILGYTNENFGIYLDVPTIIFDDFTTSSQFVNFPFKVKSSAIKILKCKKNYDIVFCFAMLQSVRYAVGGHERHWISKFSNIVVKIPKIEEQKAIAEILSTQDKEIELLQKQLEEEKQKKKALMQLLLTGIVRV